ncbi:UNVERIFIED_CONTAM: hypothetical protein HDU68_003257 [Siphonaria sp. JEL0065]|nr:hypothetical protein HDU68_003257 [Siphonaria sp. JEL0065]
MLGRLKYSKISWQWVLYLTATFFGIAVFVFVNATQSMVLTHILNIPSSQLGDKAGTISFADQIISVFAVYLFGVSSDFLGRRAVYSFGFAVMGVALCVTPRVSSYEALLGIRLLFAAGGGAASSMVTAVLADFASDEHGGKLAGLVGLCSGSGALLALFVIMPLPLKFDDIVDGIQTTYLGVGLVAIGFSVLLFVALRPYMTIASRPSKTFFQKGKEGIWAAVDPKILLGYAGSFLARGDTVILTLFIPLWVYKKYIDQGVCAASGGLEDPDIRDACRIAYLRASTISGVAQTAALVAAPLFGYLTDKLKAPNLVLFNAILGLISYSILFYANPIAGYIFAIAILVGLSEIGLIIGNMSLVTNKATVDESIRGSVAGVSSACGALGILFSSKLGGYLFDSWDEGAPFLVLAVGHLLVVICGVYVVVHERNGTVSHCETEV